jgi:hydrogenase large subunit
VATVKIIDPITRIEGHLKIEVAIDVIQGVQKVVDAHATGTMFRGFEKILEGRSPSDAQHITQRICGVCPVPHGMASVIAQDKVSNVVPPENARLMRNIVMAANFIQSHILHFYHLSLLDYIDGPAMSPWQPSWLGEKRIPDSTASGLLKNYITAIDMTRKAHEMGAIFGGRMPHPTAYIAGGFTAAPRSERINAAKNYISELLSFIQNVYISDVDIIASTYGDYHSIGRGYGNLLAFGAFDQDTYGTTKLFKRGRVKNGSLSVKSVNLNYIKEQVTYSWYNDSTNNLRPITADTVPLFPKGNAYSWTKAPRYQGLSCEVGPLARMWINGEYRNGISVMDRHKARALETLKVALACQTWINGLQAGGPAYKSHTPAINGSSTGLTEAPRGALGHWLQVTDGKISKYQIVTPTCWNASPRDGKGILGPIEKALIGTPVADPDKPIEVLRVIHSFDPCLSCAVHVVRPDVGKKIYPVSFCQNG